MNKTAVRVESLKILADIITPVSIYLKVRDIYPNALLLESSDYHSKENSFSFICMDPVAEFKVTHGVCQISLPGFGITQTPISRDQGVVEKLREFISSFEITSAPEDMMVDGVFGYSSYDAVQYFENITFNSPQSEKEEIPEVRYNFFRFVLAINHFTNELTLFENIVNGGESEIKHVSSLLHNRNIATYRFDLSGDEQSNLSDDDFRGMVRRGKEHCFRGDVFQIVLSGSFPNPSQGMNLMSTVPFVPSILHPICFISIMEVTGYLDHLPKHRLK